MSISLRSRLQTFLSGKTSKNSEPKKEESKACAQCGKTPVLNRFCSPGCYHEWLKGSNNPNYRHEGEYKRNHGVRVKVNGRQTMQHRLVMEQILGRELSDDEIVLHLDGNKLNNHASNLVLVKKAKSKRYKRIKINGREYIEHRKIMEELLGRPLKKTERVLHIDGDTLNNDPKNLIIVGV